jgi:uncharacterized protein YjdB
MITAIERAPRSRWSTFAIAAFLATAAAACGDAVSNTEDGTGPSFAATAPTSISLAPNGGSVGIGQTIQMVAKDQNGMPLQPLQWYTTDATVASITSDGKLTGRKLGRAVISARWNNQAIYSASVLFYVVSSPVEPPPTEPPPVPTVAAIVLTPTSASILRGATAQLTAQARDAAGQPVNVQITWASSNPVVASVSATGLVSGLSAGGATVTASAGGRTAASSITVTLPPPAPTPVVATVTVSPTSVTLNQGATSQLTATARDSAGNVISGQTFTWSSSNNVVATVSPSGVVTAVAAGSATVSATSSNGRRGSASVIVNATQPPTQPPPSGTRQFIFTSDWSSATGQTTVAKTDGSRWNIISDPGNGLNVLATCQSLGFPSATCLEVNGIQSATGFARLAKTGMPIPAVGESMFFRWYYRHEQPSLGDNSQHPIESGQNGGLDWCFNTETLSNTTWRPEFRTGGDQSNARLARWTGPVLQQGVTYRFEMQIQKISNTELYLHVRVYNSAGVLIASDANFTNDRLGNSGTNLLSLASNPVLHFATSGGTNLHEIRAGVNGISNSDWFPRVRYGYQGGLAVCRGNWCGAYTAGEGR